MAMEYGKGKGLVDHLPVSFRYFLQLSSMTTCEPFPNPCLGTRIMNSVREYFPIHLTTSDPFQSSQTSLEVDDSSSISAAARFYLALPTKAFSHFGPPTLMALMMIVIIPNGPMASIKLSAQPMD
jgi:hypothetical protein